MRWPWGKPVLVEPATEIQIKPTADRWAERTAELEAELAAIPEPPDIYRILKNFTDGTFTLMRWRKYIYRPARMISSLYVVPDDWRSVVNGWENLCTGLPSHKAARDWLRAFIDPSTNRTGYDKDGAPCADPKDV